MAIKTGAITVINNSYELENVADLTGNFSDFHPTVQTITTVIDMSKNVMKLDMTGNVTFTTANIGRGKQATLILDTSATPYTPTFPSEVKFNGSTPTWSSFRYWTIALTCWDGSTIRAIASGFGTASTPASSFQNFAFSPTPWFTQQSETSAIGFVEAWCFVRFSRDDANNRIKIEYAGGTSAAAATVYTVYADYTGLTGISSVDVQYNVQSQACTFDCTAANQGFGPTPVSDGYNSGTYYSVPASPGLRQFGWMAQANPNSNAQNKANVSADFTSANPDFRIKIVCNEGTFYSTGEGPSAGILLTANVGTQPAL